jgi:hydroxymethylpyrimidine/phosphomethylpyrimidine kinase
VIVPPQVVLSIAGFDPSSGAGVTADVKTIAVHGCYGICCITALTVQSTQGVRRVEPVSGGLLRESLEELFSDFRPDAVKIGMLGSAEVVQAVAECLKSAKPRNLVLDPILESSSGTPLLDDSGVKLLKELLLPLADVITPNLAEAEKLSGIAVRDLDSMRLACRQLRQLGANAVVITGGHLPKPIDLLSVGTGGSPTFHEFPGERVATGSTHGTGCAFASAIACNLANGKDLIESVREANRFVVAALKGAYQIGKGSAPINHLIQF